MGSPAGYMYVIRRNMRFPIDGGTILGNDVKTDVSPVFSHGY